MQTQHLISPNELEALQQGLPVQLDRHAEVRLQPSSAPILPPLETRLMQALVPFSEIEVPELMHDDERLTVQIPARHIRRAQSLV